MKNKIYFKNNFINKKTKWAAVRVHEIRRRIYLQLKKIILLIQSMIDSYWDKFKQLIMILPFKLSMIIKEKVLIGYK